MLYLAQKYFVRSFRHLKVHARKFVRVEMDSPQAKDFSAQLTHEKFTDAPSTLPTTPELRASRQRHLLRELRWLSTASRLDICDRLAKLAAEVDIPQGSDIYRITDLAKAAKAW